MKPEALVAREGFFMRALGQVVLSGLDAERPGQVELSY
jgi:hypothetical protein